MANNELYNNQLANQYDLKMSKNCYNIDDRNTMMGLIENYIPKHNLIIDIGGGTGTDAIYLAKKGYSICLLEPSKSMLSIAKAKIKEKDLNKQITCVNGGTQLLQEIKANTDMPISIIANFSSFNHLSNPRAELTKVSECISPNGYLIYSTNNYFYYNNFKNWRAWRTLIALIFLGVSKSASHTHTFFYYRKSFFKSVFLNFNCEKRLLSKGRISKKNNNSLLRKFLLICNKYAPFSFPSPSDFQMFVWKKGE